jgi:hypothetical protein
MDSLNQKKQSHCATHNAVAYFWRAMTQMYGSQWLNEFGEQANAAWTSALQELSNEEIECGIEQCKRSGSPFVPRLPQFLMYCKGDAEQRAFKARCEADKTVLALPKPLPNPEIKYAALAKMKAILGMK